MSNAEELISQFVDVTGVSTERAKFYIESSNSNLEFALASFFETEHEDVPMAEVGSNVDESNVEAAVADVSDLMSEVHQQIRSVGTIGSSKPKKSSTKPKVTTLFNMNKSSSSDDEEEGQAFYAGGSERSGQQVLGPPRRKPEGHDVVSEVFRLAQENGAEIVDQRNTPSSSGSLYAGAGYRLGMTLDDHEALPNATRSGSAARQQTNEPVVLKLWRQGFSINNGEIRHYEDPVNKEFLNSIKRGEIPNELRQLAGTGTVDFELEDHRHEEFKKQASKLSAFSGKGHTLGSPVPNVINEDIPPASAESNETNQKKANESIIIDETQPIAMIQVRLVDGSRISGRFNHTHTVNDIRQFVTTARPVYENQNFILLITFPFKELTDGDLTIGSAGLQGSIIMQRLK